MTVPSLRQSTDSSPRLLGRSTSQYDIVAPSETEVTNNVRMVSLDVFRGLTIAGMIVVTNPGLWSAVYWPLLHADWNGWTPTDMIFPSFLVAVGISMTLSFRARMARGGKPAKLVSHVIRRSIIILVIGLALNAFPQFDLHTLRIPGVLQRIALCYLCGGLLYLFSVSREPLDKSETRARSRVTVISVTAAAILIAYWLLLKFVPVPGFGPGRLDSLGNLGAYIDRSLLTTRHLWQWGITPPYGVTYDPEGLLSTLPAIATLLIGILVGEWLAGNYSRQRKALGLLGAGVALLLLGWLLNPLFPINKKIWTSTFALFSGGFSLIAFSFCYWLVELRSSRWWTPPALVLGTNAILAFALSTVLNIVLTNLIHVPPGNAASPTLNEWVYRNIFSPCFSPKAASLAYAVAVLLLNLGIIYLLYRKRIFLRV
jgi:predicted acyltransferase